MENRGEYALITCLMEDGLEAVVAVGGDCETFFHKGSARAWVKRPTIIAHSKPNQVLEEDK